MTEDEALLQVLARIQDEQIVWKRHNFPGQSAAITVLGCTEEYFEAQEALGDIQAYLDGVADHSIFLIDLCTVLNIQAPIALAVGRSLADFSGRPWPKHLGRLVHHFVKLEQGIRGDPQYHRTMILNAIGSVFATLEREVGLLGESYAEALTTTWAHVRRRDWIAYPNTGLPETE